MKLHFDSNQEYQRYALDSVVDFFEGQPLSIGEYRLDWVLMLKHENRLYFVAETKSTLDKTKRRESENQKIDCGYKHFEKFEDVQFTEATSLEEIQKQVLTK